MPIAKFGGHIVRLLYSPLGLAAAPCRVLALVYGCASAERPLRDDQIVPALNVAVFFGMPIASPALLWANRLLSDTLAERGAAEAWCFSVA